MAAAPLRPGMKNSVWPTSGRPKPADSLIVMIFKLTSSLLLISGMAFASERGEEIRLWPNGAPGSERETAAEVSQPSENPKLPKRFTVVHYPSIFVFLPAKEQANGTAVVVAPGGGHSQLVIDKEGYDVAEWLNKNGVAAFVLKYRLAKAAGSHYTEIGRASCRERV